MNPSSTGNPLLPPKLVPYLLLLACVAQALAFALPEHTLAAKIAQGVVSALGFLGLASPGLRSAPPTLPPPGGGLKSVAKVDEV